MGSAAATFHLAALSVSALTTAGLGVVGWWYRRRPGAKPFVGLMAATTVWTLGYVVGLLTPMYAARLFWEQMQWPGIVFVPVFLFLFIVEYTGHDDLVTPLSVGVLVSIPVVTLALVWTNPWHRLVWAETMLRQPAGLVVASQEFGPWYWVNLLYTYLLVGGSVALLGFSIYRSRRLFSRSSLLAAVGILVPLLANFASVYGLSPVEGLDLTPYAFTVTGLVFAYAIFGYGLFQRSPAVLRRGRHSALADLDDGVLVTDDDGVVVFANAAARAVFTGPPVGDRLETLLPDHPEPGATGLCPLADRVYEVSASRITGGAEPIGVTYLLYDVTDREARLAELERQRSELDALNHINGVIRSVGRVLVSSPDRETIRDGVCHQLAVSAPYADAQITSERRDEPAVEPLPDGGGERAVVPLVYEETAYGTLFVDRADGVGVSDRELAILVELGEGIGLALNAAEARQTLVSDSVVDIDYAIASERSLLAGAAAATETTLGLRGCVTVDDEELLLYLDAGEAAADVVTWLAEQAAARTVRVVDDDGTVELRVAGPTALHTLSAHGVQVREATADRTGLRLAVRTASGNDVRALTDALDAAVGGVTVLAKRERRRRDFDTLPTDPLGLTARQREALESAYLSGYFGWPRDSTAEEVADAMGLAPSTFHSHLRKAEAKLIESHLDPE
ncbi:histidine kinase N-terminal 7TM domain-containing protein [Natronomonas sp. EA1]|uniref:histidine kinase N-terminal 7TM domain-containing protein n=1 Tax=Natronomonas sp. EA1 TaxID=3421655 RepID=UPI003EBCC3AD